MPTREQIISARQLRSLQAKKDELTLKKQKTDQDLKAVTDSIRRHRASTKKRKTKKDF